MGRSFGGQPRYSTRARTYQIFCRFRGHSTSYCTAASVHNNQSRQTVSILRMKLIQSAASLCFRLSMLFCFSWCIVSVSSTARAATDPLDGVWLLQKPYGVTRTTEGKEPPLLPEAKAI